MTLKRETSKQASVLLTDADLDEQNVSPQASSVDQLLQEAIDRLRDVTDTPRLEAEVLLMHLLGTPRTTLLAHPERCLTAEQVARYRDFISERASGYPLPYITGRAEFYGLDFEVTPEVMIPRPETETLVDLALEYDPSTVVDVGTGSGCIAIALAKHLPEATVYGIDVSPPALAVARRNVEHHDLEDRVQLMVGDVLSPRPARVDLIVSNPPYVSAEEWLSLPASVRHHEPQVALDGGTDGLRIFRELMVQSQGILEPGGALLIEIGADQGEAAVQLAETYYPPSDGVSVRVHPDLAGRDRVLEVRT